MKNENWYQHLLNRDELKIFIKESRIGKDNKQAFIGFVDEVTAKKIEEICGEKVKRIMIDSGAIRHSYRKESHHLSDNDLLSIENAINNATYIKVSETKHQNNKCLEICKDINGEITFIMEVRIHHGGWLALVTCYRKNRGGATL